MKTIEKDLKSLFALQGDEFEDRLQFLKQKYISEEDKKMLAQALLQEMSETKKEMLNIDARLDEMITMKEQLKDIREIVSLSYIAKHYFGKTRSWLYQRLYGYSVRGKICSLNEKEKEILNLALKDISKKIGSVSVN